MLKSDFMTYFLVDILLGETEKALFSRGNTVYFLQGCAVQSPSILTLAVGRWKVPRFVATSLGVAAAWKTKKKSFIFLFFFLMFALLQGVREGRAG